MKDLKASTSKSATDYIDVSMIYGYAIKKKELEDWLEENEDSFESMAEALGIEKEEFIRRLGNKELFNRWEIQTIVYYMGAEEAFYVLDYPTKKLEKQVYEEFFGEKMPDLELKSEVNYE